MHPLPRSHIDHWGTSLQHSPAPYSSLFSTDSSPSLYSKSVKFSSAGNDISFSGPNSQDELPAWVDNGETISRRSSRLQIELAECVETRTITTTTTTKRSYSPWVINHSKLDKLDRKEYPLASKSPPPHILHHSKMGTNCTAFQEGRLPQKPENILSDRSQANDDFFRDAHDTRLQRHIYPSGSKETSFQSSFRTSRDRGKKIEKKGSKNFEWHCSIPSELSSRKKSSLKKRIDKNIVDEGVHEVGRSLRRRNCGIQPLLRENQLFPITPDVSDLRLSASNSSGVVQSIENSSAAEFFHNSLFNAPCSISVMAEDTVSSTVATPPIAEFDQELSDAAISNNPLHTFLTALGPEVVQSASLPSPGLSPTFTPDDTRFNEDDDRSSIDASISTTHDSYGDAEPLDFFSTPESNYPCSWVDAPSLRNMELMIDTFDSMPNDIKTSMMFQLLRRCSRKTLHVIADVVNPALKCNFLVQLPLELSLHILSYLDYQDLCRSAQVSKQWRNIVDSNETGWKEIFDRDGYILPAGELEKAINQGWGWQDPHGSDGYEQDLSIPTYLSVDSRGTFEGRSSNSSVRKVRTAVKRKRDIFGTETSKRRAISHDFTEISRGSTSNYLHTIKFHKSEGPLTAANAAILAVPDPQIGIPSLRRLHLFKSLYRRHYMLQQSWMSGKVTPHHFAFPAHPAHVITCLQFDDDKIITGSDDTLIHVYNTKTGILRKKLEGHEGGVWALQYEGNILVSGSTDRSVRVWDIEKGLCTQVFHGHTSTVRCLQILMPEPSGYNENGHQIMVPDKPLIITGSRDSQLRVWKLPEQGSKRYIQTGPPANDSDCPYFVRVLAGHSHSVRAISAHQDTLVSGSYDNTVRVWKISTGESVHRLTGHTMKVYSVVLDHKRDRCISGSMDNFIRIWSILTGACLFTLEGHSSLVGLLDLHDDRLVSAAADSTLRIWDPENGQCKSTLSAHTGAITCFQHDGQKVISGSDRSLKLWNIKTGECIKDLLVDLSGVWQVKFDERRCVAAVQRDNLTFVEVLDFGASRDGVPAYQRGSRRLLAETTKPAVVNEDSEDS
ncbi:BgTH12-06987 [Blumeria graminis f. sp. triticale]|uniref:BgtA-21110 n=3 Tax=Blumeria graminis TaxID=34373 RepID=A0A9X9MP10_BLUGR|nr:hypothetical protein BGT96224_A21110 [Blumeria graminis f. sp. tritici 96224]CAD6506055.1 BgTH12-06987 [Blumeria graminis f. sp. triticale]VDB94706.1 BgtA-21110 [Blumeria graminis f. sp. tritici]